MDINKWLELAGSYIPFRKEREAVQAEILDHFCDRADALVSTGMEWSEAKKRALAALGDPDETGKLLREVHKPWLTRALRITRILLVVLLLAAFISLGSVEEAVQKRIENCRLEDPTYLQRYFTSSDRTETTTCAFNRGTVEGSGRFGSRPITAGKAWTRWIRYRNADDSFEEIPVGTMFYEKHCIVFLKFGVPFWIDPDLRTIQEHTTVTNSRGQALGFACFKGNQTPTACTVCFWVYGSADTDDLRLRCSTGEIFFDFRARFGVWEDVDGWFSKPAPADETALLESLGPPNMIQYNYPSRYSFAVLYDSLCESEPVHTETLEISVPWAELRNIERRPKPKDSEADEADQEDEEEEEPLRFSTVDFILKLQGPWEELFLMDNDVSGRLSVTDSLGNKAIDVSAVRDYSFTQDAPMVFADRGYYRLCAEMLDDGARAEWYELTLDLRDGPVTLRLTPTERR